MLAAPFVIANILLLIPRAATTGITERYLLGPILVALPCLVRYYQERVQLQLPLASVLLVAIMAIFGITLTHNLFSFYRARVALVAELSAAGVPPTSVDNGWEYNTLVELQHTTYINNFRMVVPVARLRSNASSPRRLLPHERLRRISPHPPPLRRLLRPQSLLRPRSFAPVHYSRWPYATPGTLYVVRYTSPSRQ